MQTDREIDHLFERCKAELPEPKEQWPFKVKKTVHYLHQHLFDPVPISFVYEQCNITDKNFAGTFSACTGLTPKQYVQYHRIECAKRILVQARNKGFTIIRFALRSGFLTHSAFTRAFKKWTGMTPSQWIAENNQGKS